MNKCILIYTYFAIFWAHTIQVCYQETGKPMKSQFNPDQTHSLLIVAGELLECVWPFCEVGA